MFLSYARPSTTITIKGEVEDIRLKAEAKDSPSEDRPSRGQSQGHRRKCSPKKKRSSKKIFRRSRKTKKGLQTKFSGKLQKKGFKIFFQAIYKILTVQKIVLSSSRGQSIFWGLEASRPRTWPSSPRTSKYVIEDSTSNYNSSRRDIRQENLSIERVTKYFWEFCRNGRWLTSL